MPEPLLLTPEETAAQLGLGRTKTFELIREGLIESVLIGRLRRVPADAVPRYVSRLRSEQGQAGAAA
jgi:excisionase family DNA binding protein